MLLGQTKQKANKFSLPLSQYIYWIFRTIPTVRHFLFLILVWYIRKNSSFLDILSIYNINTHSHKLQYICLCSNSLCSVIDTHIQTQHVLQVCCHQLIYMLEIIILISDTLCILYCF
jgi:hypothetical protein